MKTTVLHRSGGGGRAVLVTGCSSGIGRETALKLAANGFTVFATVRKETDADNLRSLGIDNLAPICPVDLTHRTHIANAAAVVANELSRRGLHGLYALVNNAGGGSPAPVELLDLDQLSTELEIRIVGTVALAQTFLPLIRQAGGRIVWITTPALIPTPYVASIHACDFAVNCIARTLDIELKTWGIPSIMIRCGGIQTPAGFRTTADVEAILRQEPGERVALYASALRTWAREMSAFDARRTHPDKVAERVLAALTAQQPRQRYSVGHMASLAAALEAMPQTITDWILKRRF